MTAAPQLAGALDGLEPLQPADLARYQRAVEAGRQLGWAYYFPYLLARGSASRSAVLIAEECGALCLFLWRARERGERLDLLLPPVPMHPTALSLSLERANDFNADRSARVLRLDADDAALAASLPGLRVRPRKEQYLYAPAAFADLGGRRYRTLRRNVARIEGLPDLEVLPYTPGEHADACLALLRRWARHHRDAHGTAGGTGTSRRALDLAARLPALVRGEVIYLAGRLVAYALGGEIRPGIGCFFEAKTEPAQPGLAYFQRYRFLSGCATARWSTTARTWVVPGSDSSSRACGRPGCTWSTARASAAPLQRADSLSRRRPRCAPARRCAARRAPR